MNRVFYDTTHTELSYGIATFLLHTYVLYKTANNFGGIQLTHVLGIFSFLMGPVHMFEERYRLCMPISYTPFSHDTQNSNAFLPSTVHTYTHAFTHTHALTCTPVHSHNSHSHP